MYDHGHVHFKSKVLACHNDKDQVMTTSKELLISPKELRQVTNTELMLCNEAGPLLGKNQENDLDKFNSKNCEKIINEKKILREVGQLLGKKQESDLEKVNGKGCEEIIDERKILRDKEKGKKIHVGGPSLSLTHQFVKKKVTINTLTTYTKVVNERHRKDKGFFSFLGQRHESPQERDPLRIFYESLREQIPSSEMAEAWLMEHGLLSIHEAKKALEHKRNRMQSLKHGYSTLFKSFLPSRKSNGSMAMRRLSISTGKGKEVGMSKGKNKKINSDSEIDDFLE